MTREPSRRRLPCGLLLGGCRAAADPPPLQAEPRSRPNILLIVADDLGYTDMGAFGGEIATPTLDALAEGGVRLAQFYVAPTCSPTRSMLMSGTDNHLAGLGTMARSCAGTSRDNPATRGFSAPAWRLCPSCSRARGTTFMTGTWHLGLDEATSPAARGSERSFALLQGGGGHFSDLPLVLSDAMATRLGWALHRQSQAASPPWRRGGCRSS